MAKKHKRDFQVGRDLEILNITSLSTGSAGAPSLTFTSDADSGLYLISADKLGLSCGGTARLSLSSSALTVAASQVLGLDGAVGVPTYSFSSDTDTGIWSSAVGNLDFTIAGVNVMNINANRVDSQQSFQAPNGSQTSPSYRFGAEQNTGVFLDATNVLAYAINGVTQWRMKTTGGNPVLECSGNGIVSANGSLSLNIDVNADETAEFRINSNVGTLTGGTNLMLLNESGDLSINAATTGGKIAAKSSTSAYLDLDSAVNLNSGLRLYEASTFKWQLYNDGDASDVFKIDHATGNALIITQGAQVQFQPGTAALPSITFSNDNDTGFYSPFAGGLSVTRNGALEAQWDANGFQQISQIGTGDGSAAKPGFFFNNQFNLGMYRKAAGQLGFTMNGVNDVTFTTGEITSNIPIRVTNGSAASPSFSFNSSNGAGIYLPSSNTLAFSTAGVQRFQIDSTGKTNVFHSTASSQVLVVEAQHNTYAQSVQELKCYRTGSASWNFLSCQVDTDVTPTTVFEIRGDGRLRCDYGTEATPGYAFSGDPNTGIRRVNSTTLGFSGGSTQIFAASLNSTVPQIQMGGSGSAAFPSYTWGGDADTGIFLVAAGQMGFAVNGLQKMEIRSSDTIHNHRVYFQDGSATEPSIGFINDAGQNTGLYKNAENNVSTTCGGATIFTVTPSQVIAQIAGTTALPAITIGDASNGFYRPVANALGVSCANTEITRFDVNALNMINNKPIWASVGSASSPSISFGADADSGFFSSAANEIGTSAGGVQLWRYTRGNGPAEIICNNNDMVFTCSQDIVINIDSDNSTSNAAFSIRKDNQGLLSGSFLFAVNENGNVEFAAIGTTASAANAFLDSTNNNRLSRSTSSKRYKLDIETLTDIDSELVYQLRPVTYKSNPDTTSDTSDRTYLGFIAEEVYDVDEKLVHFIKDENDELIPDGVMYDRVVVLLQHEVKKQKSEKEQLQSRVDELESTLSDIITRLSKLEN